MYFNLSAEAVARYWLSKGFFDGEKDALRVTQSVFTERDTDPRAELLQFISKSVEDGKAEPEDFDRVSKAYQNSDWETVMSVLGRINLIEGLSKSAIPNYGQAMLLADEALFRQGITSHELLKLDYLLKERARVTGLAKGIDSAASSDYLAERLGTAELEAQKIWDRVVDAVKG